MTFEEFRRNLPIQLNRQQLAAIQAVDRPTLLLAVPGSGKTTVLVARLGYMISCCNIAPEKILTVTYTVAATRDMRERFAGFFGEELANRLEFRTINGICARIIAYYGRLIGKTPHQLLTDEKQIAAILSRIFQQTEGEYATESDLKNVRTYITYIKNRMLAQEQIRELEEEAGVGLKAIYREYGRQLKAQGLMDYDDQMVYAYAILRRCPEVLSYFQSCYPYICVDEAQDTSKIQHEIIALLASGADRLFMVGDEDQSIYGFRAAYPEALLNFETDHPGAQILFMEENFRSNARIVAAADQFIRLNTKRREKHMRAAREAQANIREIELRGRRAQYSYLAKVAADCQTQTAVLYRNHESIIPLVDLLERSGTPYRLRNADPTFFTHRVVLDLLNIIRFAYEPKNTELFLQIYYKLSTFLGRQTALRVCEISTREKLPVLDAALHHAGLTGNEKKNLTALRTHLEHMKEDSAEQALNRITKYMGYGEYLARAQMSDSKLFILKSVAAGVDTPLDFVERMAQLQEIMRNKTSEEDCPFILSTIHASKGLEYDTVYLVDVQDGLFPESVPKNGRHSEPGELEAYEEERRLFYVAVTRAREQLMIFGLPGKSSFREQLMGRSGAQTKEQQTLKGSAADQKSISKKQKEALSEVEFRKFTELLGEGLLVEHKKFGAGVVVTVTQKRIRIQFADQTREFDLRLLFKSQLLTPELL